jgi:adenine-specific DNA-methyltransferase
MPLFDLVVTSPPYRMGKAYEKGQKFRRYLEQQRTIITACVARLKSTGSICWQVGSHITGAGKSSAVIPLDVILHPIFEELGLKLRSRIIWHFGHGLHASHRFSGRYETILWYSKSNNYTFNLDAVRVPQKYPGKRYYRRGEKYGQYSGNPLGKNPSDVWGDIPNVKGKHPEKTQHPCQFPVALAERLILALTRADGLVFDPFAGVASTGVAAIRTKRRFWGCELKRQYVMTGLSRLKRALDGSVAVRPLDKPVFNPAHAWKGLLSRSS